jgi:hypothetical protein
MVGKTGCACCLYSLLRTNKTIHQQSCMQHKARLPGPALLSCDSAQGYQLRLAFGDPNIVACRPLVKNHADFTATFFLPKP